MSYQDMKSHGWALTYIWLNERNQSEETAYCVILYMWHSRMSKYSRRGKNIETIGRSVVAIVMGVEEVNRKNTQNFQSVWSILYSTLTIQFSSVAQSCTTLCDTMNCSTQDLPVHHQLLEFTQTHVHQVSDAIQPSHPLSSPSPPAPNSSQHQSLFQWVISSPEVPKVLEFPL